MPLGHQAVDAEEEARLVGGRDHREGPHARGRETTHSGDPREVAETAGPDVRKHRVGGGVVGVHDHPRQQEALVPRDAGVGAQVLHQQHRLDHAGRAELRIVAVAVKPAAGVDHGERRHPDAPAEPALGGGERRGRRPD